MSEEMGFTLEGLHTETGPGVFEAAIAHSDALRAGVHRFLTALPRDAAIYGVKLDKDKQPTEASLSKAAPGLVLVEVSLE